MQSLRALETDLVNMRARDSKTIAELQSRAALIGAHLVHIRACIAALASPRAMAMSEPATKPSPLADQRWFIIKRNDDVAAAPQFWAGKAVGWVNEDAHSYVPSYTEAEKPYVNMPADGTWIQLSREAFRGLVSEGG